MMMIAFDLLMSMFQAGLLIYTMSKQFEQRPHSFLYEAISVFLNVLYLAIIQYCHLPVPDSLGLLIPLLYIKLTTDKSFISCALWTLLDGSVFFGTLTLVSALFDLRIAANGTVMTGTDDIIFLYSFVGNAAVALTMNIAARLNRFHSGVSGKETFVFLTMLLLGFLTSECFFSVRMTEDSLGPAVFGAACSFGTLLLTMLLYELLADSARKRQQAELSAQIAQLTAKHQNELKDIYQNMLSEQHDLRHRIAVAEELLSVATADEEKTKSVLALLSRHDEPCRFITGSISVDAILKAKSSVMENAGISFEFADCPLSSLPISEQDFCLLLCNLLDNAIEGVMRLPASAPSRHIRLSFSRVWNMLFITCVNDADTSTLKRKGQSFISSKEQPEKHGFGTISIRKTVEEAGGTIEFNAENGRFTVQIMIGGTSAC